MAKRKSQLALTLNVLRGRLAEDERGATAIEYALLASGIGAAVAITVYSLGSTTQEFYSLLSGLFG
jgi:Flp pilus assembly pilin Flp